MFFCDSGFPYEIVNEYSNFCKYAKLNCMCYPVLKLLYLFQNNQEPESRLSDLPSIPHSNPKKNDMKKVRSNSIVLKQQRASYRQAADSIGGGGGGGSGWCGWCGWSWRTGRMGLLGFWLLAYSLLALSK